ncbi:MAG: endonuclease/exonuclease/phosphatase family protein, partial [Prevotella sp.]|nr:endonuclease/exonuclease/phosphatase family protein [Prevotella sp.]
NTHAMIICGDFNDTPFSYAYQTIRGNFVDSFKETGNGFGFTYHENAMLMRIDYIMHTKNIVSFNCEVGNVKYSDHYPIWSYLSLKKV